MLLKTKENKTKVIIVLEVVILILIVTIVVSNRRIVLDKVGNLFNVNETNKTEETLNNGEEAQTVSTEKWDLEKVNIVYDKDNVAVPVPKGYVASSVENGVTPIGQEIAEENRVRTGFVIYEMTAEEIKNGTEVSITKDNFWEESKKRNQWVWVPVPDSSRIYERDASTGKAKAKLWSFTETERVAYYYGNEPGVLRWFDNEKNFAENGVQGVVQNELLQELEKDFEATIESIEQYGGFYVGRYETGNFAQKSPVVQRMNRDIGNQTWYEMYMKMKNISRKENIKTGMIWDCLWDEILQWLIETDALTDEIGTTQEKIVKDSSSWGNYVNVSSEYTTSTEKLGTTSPGFYTPAGSSERNKANNIYDMAGNAYEYTLAGNDMSGRYTRGGYLHDRGMDFSVSYRNNNVVHEPNTIYLLQRKSCLFLYKIKNN